MRLKRRKAYNLPISWSQADERLLLRYLEKESLDMKSLQKLFPTRTLPSIRSKVRKLRIKHDLFGASYRAEKEGFTLQIAERICPKIVFDAYAGAGHQTIKWSQYADAVFASDIMKGKLGQFSRTLIKNGFCKLKKKGNWEYFIKGKKKIFFFSGDAIDAAAELKVKGIKVDTMDLDTCGSTLPTLPILLSLLKPRHLLITHGEYHSMRFRREDVLRRLLVHRDIRKNPLPLEADQMSKELDKAVRVSALRVHNETKDSLWAVLKETIWLGGKFHGMLRRYYKLQKPPATADCINSLSR